MAGNGGDVGLTKRQATVAGVQVAADTRPVSPGDLVMTTMTGTTPSANLLRRARQGRIAGVLLMGRNVRSPAQVRKLTAALQAAAYAGGNPPLIIAVDQEGGTTRRFRSFPPDQGARGLGSRAVDEIRSEGRQTGVALRSVGVNVDLAPVADVAAGARSFLGSRAFGGGAKRVSVAACAFSAGLHEAGVVPTLKHFPGLGGSAVNTDDAGVAIPFGLARLKRDLTPYQRCGAQPASLTMVSNARYTHLTGNVPAVLSPATYRLARELGVTGPFITDSLNAKSLVGQANIATRAVNAGASLLLFTSEGSSVAGYRELLRATNRGAVSPETLEARARPVRDLRRQLWTGG